MARWSTAGLLCVLAALTILPSGAVDPGDFPSPKTWWAKRISSDLYTAGRLTERQIKYTADAGFGTIVSLFTLNDNYMIGDDRVLSTNASRDVAERLGGLGYYVVLAPGEEMATVTTVNTFAALMSLAAKPVILHCVTAQSASLIALNFLSQTTGLSSRDIYSRGALLGYNFAAKPKYRRLIEAITGEPPMANPPTPDATIPAWNKKYWLIKPVYKNWYLTGQIQSNQAGNLSSMGVDGIVNCRQRAISGRREVRWPSQEEVVLLNVKDNTGTYEGTGRQSTERLLVTRIDPTKPNEYISPESTVNYQRENSLEYGDDVGYNAGQEKRDMESKTLTYHQTPPDNSKHGELAWLYVVNIRLDVQEMVVQTVK